MPKFVSGSSGQIYARDKSKNDDDEDLNLLLGNNEPKKPEKPSAINKKGTKEKQKNSLDLFKEELRRLHEERNNPKKSAKEPSSRNPTAKPQIVPVPLKPDPRCPTTLTLLVNMTAKDLETSMSGSFDTGDPTTTNLYLGNLNPIVNENDLLGVFGKFGPLASIKIMWPRTDEERARNRNSGFVAYMSRIDAERALQALNGKDFKGYDMKLGWGKAVPIPQIPVYVPPELIKLTEPPPQSGLPFNGQMHQSDITRGYVVPNPYPRPLPEELEARVESNPDLKAIKDAYNDFMGVVERSTVRVVPPRERSLLDRIHKTIEYVIKEGPVFEAIIIARENKNPLYTFLYDNRSHEHIYYRWKLYSILHGDDPYEWRTDEFRMFESGPIWKPPPLNPYAEGMPVELIEGADNLLDANPIKKASPFSEKPVNMIFSESRVKGTLGKVKRDMLGDILRNLDPTKTKVGSAMMFCINHADAAKEIIECIHESLKLLETPFQKKIARLFLVCDILHNCSAAVTNASYYREGFQTRLVPIFEHLREYLVSIEDRSKADKFKQKVLSVLGAWKEWTLYEDEMVIKLSNILLGLKQEQQNTALTTTSEFSTSHQCIDSGMKQREEDLDGEPLDEEALSQCLKEKGLSLRWYKSLELSDDEEEEDGNDTSSQKSTDRSPMSVGVDGSVHEFIKFKSSKWETIDPGQVAEQVVTISKWEAMAKEEEEEAPTDSSSSIASPGDNATRTPNCDNTGDSNSQSSAKRFKVEDGSNFLSGS